MKFESTSWSLLGNYVYLVFRVAYMFFDGRSRMRVVEVVEHSLMFKYVEFLQLERQNVMAAQTLQAALSKAESSQPGITHDLIMGIVRKAELNLDMNESVLRLQGAASDYDGKIHTYLYKKSYLILVIN